MESKSVDFKKALLFGIDNLKKKPQDLLVFGAVYFVAMIVCVAISFGISFLGALVVMKIPMLSIPMKLFVALFSSGIGALVSGFALGGLLAPFLSFVDKTARGEQSSFLQELKSQTRFMDMFVGMTIVAFAASLLSHLCVLPGLLALPLFGLVPYLVWKGSNGVDAVKNGVSIMIQQPLPAVLIGALAFLGGLGAILCLVGVIATVPAAVAGNFNLCGQLLESSEGSKPAAQ